MVEVGPFRGISYNSQKVSMDRVLAPPYDVISEEQRKELYGRDPHNVIRLILGKNAKENKEKNLYGNAAEYLENWLSEGVLVREEKPSFYIYEQNYTLDGQQYSRTGIICLLGLEPFENGNVLPHEFTLSAPKQDRLELMRACNANLSQIFCLYSGNKETAELINAEKKRHAVADIDFEGVNNRVWIVDETKKVKKIQDFFANEKVFIADGHHRYETALKYMEENTNASGVLSCLVDMNNEGLVILPTHRAVYDLGEEKINSLEEELGKFFDLRELNNNKESIEKELKENFSKHAFVLYKNNKAVLFTLKGGLDLGNLMQEGNAALQKLDVSILHGLVLKKILGIDKEMVLRKEKIDYVKDIAEAVAGIDAGKYQAAFLMNATPIEQMKAVCLSGARMPQKSTYFYPKLVSGLVINKIDGGG